jgi:hypothetical protein
VSGAEADHFVELQEIKRARKLRARVFLRRLAIGINSML